VSLSKAEARLGLTPAFLRIAHYYLLLGYGEYYPKHHPHYDHVVVRLLYDFGENPMVPGEYAGGSVVEFFQGDRRIKFVDFRNQVVGGGGDSLLKEVL
jgi:hypothetical protein